MAEPLTVDQEQALCERLGRNQHEAEMRRLYADIKYAEALDTIHDPLELECVVCGSKMKAQRRSKKTCSSACRLKLSRWLRGWRALPQAERNKREAEVKKRWRRARAAERAAEKRKPKKSREEILAEIIASFKDMKRELKAAARR